MTTCNVCNTKPAADDIRYSGMCTDCYQADCEAGVEQAETMAYNMHHYGTIDAPRYDTYTIHDPLMCMMAAVGEPAFRRHTRLHKIVLDGWGRGLDPAQTAMEAILNGYSWCVVQPFINGVWTAMDKALAEYEASRYDDLPPSPLSSTL